MMATRETLERLLTACLNAKAVDTAFDMLDGADRENWPLPSIDFMIYFFARVDVIRKVQALKN